MSVASKPETGTLSGTVFTPRHVRILKIAVIVMGVLLVGGFAFVLAAIVYQASRPAQVGVGMGERAGSIDLPIPRDATVAGVSLDGNRLAVQLNGASGPEIAIIDLASGKVIALVRLKPQ
ncbi:MAG TPA: hypothetical protein VED02_03935 [Methyloceanibacter sp.]|nr:hypothetical protein [Methyloceanibacter sp.]